jgi:iron complex transport system substrate-binding protein
MLKRRHLCVMLCGLLAVMAVSLRIREGLHREHLVVAAAGFQATAGSPSGPGGRPAGPPLLTTKDESFFAPPRDYVLHPDVAPGEENQGPARIISLAPSITETLCALGLQDRLVGRTQFCLYPPKITRPGGVPVVGGIMDTNLEMIRALQPDLVLNTANSGDVGPRLDALRLRHESLPHDSLEDVFVGIERAGVVCGRPQTAHQLVAAIRADLERLQNAVREAHARQLRVLVVCGDFPVPPSAVWVAGPGLFLDTLLRSSGHRNAAADLLKAPFGEIPLERLVVLDPDVILTFPDRPLTETQTAEIYRSWSPLACMQAIRSQHIRPVGSPQWLSAGPRIAIELHQLISVLGEFP